MDWMIQDITILFFGRWSVHFYRNSLKLYRDTKPAATWLAIESNLVAELWSDLHLKELWDRDLQKKKKEEKPDLHPVEISLPGE